MIEYEKENKTVPGTPPSGVPKRIDGEQGTIQNVVCPKCFRPLPYPTIVSTGTDRYKRELRTYFGWCFKCDKGFEVIQFVKDNLWLIHKYQPYSLAGKQLVCMPTGEWTVLNKLPEPAAVIIGPGGDYDKQFDPELANLLEKLQKALNSVGEILKHLTADKRAKENGGIR